MPSCLRSSHHPAPVDALHVRLHVHTHGIVSVPTCRRKVNRVASSGGCRVLRRCVEWSSRSGFGFVGWSARLVSCSARSPAQLVVGSRPFTREAQRASVAALKRGCIAARSTFHRRCACKESPQWRTREGASSYVIYLIGSPQEVIIWGLFWYSLIQEKCQCHDAKSESQESRTLRNCFGDIDPCTLSTSSIDLSLNSVL